ncbi:MAG: diaminopimelate epimerase [Blastocatellia bacterium]|nr:MAG: diaminopimelate epimerase [Blastocatellia bacterium]
MLQFTKAHAYGNDFIYVDRGSVGDLPLAPLTRELCDRHTGIGADGLIVYSRTADGAAMSLLNADGSHAEVSGNGIRALAALILENDHRTNIEIRVDTEAGPKVVTRTARSGSRQTFRAAMGTPTELRQVSVTAGGESVAAVILKIGNPQCVVLGPLPEAERFRRVGAALEHHTMFPSGTNVEFAAVEAPGRVRILIWERGCGPTMSSGTGSCAALVAAASFGGALRRAEIVAPGGVQYVEWLDDNVYLTGWAEVVCRGEWLRALPHE